MPSIHPALSNPIILGANRYAIIFGVSGSIMPSGRLQTHFYDVDMINNTISTQVVTNFTVAADNVTQM